MRKWELNCRAMSCFVLVQLYVEPGNDANVLICLNFLSSFLVSCKSFLNTRIKDLVQLPSTKTAKYGLNSLRFRGHD